MDEHPLIYFRDGASGRRPALLGTRLDVADVIETIRENDRSVERTAAYLELPVDRIEHACATTPTTAMRSTSGSIGHTRSPSVRRRAGSGAARHWREAAPG
jgi:uncharacterized protein (DUF433 family)